MTAGKELRVLRKRRGLTLKAFGEQCGISGDELARYERGERDPREANTRRIAEALGEPIQTIRNGIAWMEADEAEASPDLSEGVLQLLREAYGPVEAGHFKDRFGVERSYYMAGASPERFLLYEEDLSTVTASMEVAALSLAEHMKDLRPEEEVQRELLGGLRELPPEDTRYALTDEQWASIRDLFPPERSGRGRAYKDNRLMLEGILYWMRTGEAWRKLPKRFGRYRSVYDRLRKWNETGVWPEALAEMLALGIIKEHEIMVDSTRFRERL